MVVGAAAQAPTAVRAVITVGVASAVVALGAAGVRLLRRPGTPNKIVGIGVLTALFVVFLAGAGIGAGLSVVDVIVGVLVFALGITGWLMWRGRL